MPLAGGRLERVSAAVDERQLRELPDLARVRARGDLLAQFLALLACLLERHFRIRAERHPPLPSGKEVPESPAAPAGRGDLQVQASSVIQPDGLAPWLGVLDLKRREHS